LVVDSVRHATHKCLGSSYRSDGRIASPHVVAVQPGKFSVWMKARGRLGGQNKVSHVINDTAIFSGLLAFVTAFPNGQ
jgi:hypothetical protein